MAFTDDPLKVIEKDIRSFLSERGIVAYPATIQHDNALGIAHWPDEESWETFLELGIACGVKLVYLNDQPFDDVDLEEASDADVGADPALREARRKIARKYKPYVGKTAWIDLSFVHNAVHHTFQVAAPWFDDFSEELAAAKHKNGQGPKEAPARRIDP